MSRDTTSSVLLLGLIATVSSSGCVVAGQPDAATSFSVEALDNPAPPGSTTPNLTADSAGRVYLSWVAREADVDRMQYAVLVGATWSEPVTIAAGDDWFVNWADVSSLAVDDGGPGHLVPSRARNFAKSWGMASPIVFPYLTGQSYGNTIAFARLSPLGVAGRCLDDVVRTGRRHRVACGAGLGV